MSALFHGFQFRFTLGDRIYNANRLMCGTITQICDNYLILDKRVYVPRGEWAAWELMDKKEESWTTRK